MILSKGNSYLTDEAIDKALSLDNKSSLAYYAKGVYLLQSNSYKEASEMFSNSINENAYFARAYTLKAYCEYKIGNYGLSTDYIFTAFYRDPYDYFNRLIYANILDESGMQTIATDEKNKAAKLYDLAEN